MSDFVQPIAQSNYELVPLPGAFITDGRFVRYEDDKNISDTVKDFDSKIDSATEAAEEASDKADALDVRVTALENKPSGDDYTSLKNKPKINGVELSGNKTAEDLGLYSKPSGGIPKTDLAEAVQQEISGKIDAPQTATVGQVLAVKAVDASGKPTEWETVEKGGGSGDADSLLKALVLERTDLPYQFYNGSVVVLNGEIHILGGSGGGTYHYKYDGTSWISVSALPYQFDSGSAVVLNDEIHIFGSSNGDYNTKHYKYNGKSWRVASTLPYQFAYGSAVVLNDEVHILGGSGYDSATRHYKYNGTSWSVVSTLRYQFGSGSAVVLNDEIHILGGNNSSTYHYKYNGTSWSMVSTLPYQFYNGSAVVLNGEIHILGGNVGNTNHYKYSGTSWKAVSTLPYQFNRGSAVVMGERCIALLGGTGVYFVPKSTSANAQMSVNTKIQIAF